MPVIKDSSWPMWNGNHNKGCKDGVPGAAGADGRRGRVGEASEARWGEHRGLKDELAGSGPELGHCGWSSMSKGVSCLLGSDSAGPWMLEESGSASTAGQWGAIVVGGDLVSLAF